jgi:hypothetical protein
MITYLLTDRAFGDGGNFVSSSLDSKLMAAVMLPAKNIVLRKPALQPLVAIFQWSGRSGRRGEEKILDPIVQHIASRYTDYAIPARLNNIALYLSQ